MGWMSNATPRPLYLPKCPGTDCIGGWVGSGSVWTAAESLTPEPEFDPRIVHPVASRYTN